MMLWTFRGGCGIGGRGHQKRRMSCRQQLERDGYQLSVMCNLSARSLEGYGHTEQSSRSPDNWSVHDGLVLPSQVATLMSQKYQVIEEQLL